MMHPHSEITEERDPVRALEQRVAALRANVTAIERALEVLEAMAKPSGLAVRIELAERLGSLERRVDGVEAAVGELRAELARRRS
jgi:hypothetical protein